MAQALPKQPQAQSALNSHHQRPGLSSQTGTSSAQGALHRRRTVQQHPAHQAGRTLSLPCDCISSGEVLFIDICEESSVCRSCKHCS